MVDGSLTKASIQSHPAADVGEPGTMADEAPSSFNAAMRAVSGLALLLLSATPLAAQATDAPAAVAVRVEASRGEYDAVRREIQLSEERRAALAEDIAEVKKDFASITAALIQSAKTEKKLAEDIEAIADRLAALKVDQDAVRASLAERREVLAEVLGALQRMGLNPPPALLVKPEDALSSVRSAILLGAVVPELREQTEILMVDLRELSRIRASIEAEREKLAATAGDQLAEKERLSLLLDEKERLQGERQAAMAVEKQRAEELAARAGSLKDLIAGLERQAARAEAARRADVEKARRAAELAAMPVPEANRLTGPAPFAALKRQLALPVTGRMKRRFGDRDDNGGVMLGDMVATQSTAIVTAPSDGTVLYAGAFRSYGQLLILDAGDGYHVVLAGMSRISVAPGQAVLAGEPVGAMGEARVASAAAGSEGSAAQELYVEFRKDGKPVDPAPWWSERLSGRAANGT